MFNQTAKQIADKLRTAGVSATVTADRFGAVTVDAECDTMARDVLGLARFRDYIDGVEVVIV